MLAKPDIDIRIESCFDHLEDDFNSVGEGDLHLLFKYYLAVVPRTEQTSGFALILDRRSDHTSDHTGVRTTLRKIVHLFPARYAYKRTFVCLFNKLSGVLQ